MSTFLGLDVGAVSTNFAALDGALRVIHSAYLRTQGDPLGSVRSIMRSAGSHLAGAAVSCCGATGSGRNLAAALMGADVVKNEITAHARGTLQFFPEARTIIEIGGQDSKIILLRDGFVVDFAMNTVCAAGTGSFLDYQAGRLGLTIQEFARLAEEASESVRVAGRCAVFAETDILEKQQRGIQRAPIAKGLCEALARNFLATVAGGKRIEPPVVFQGGVASNVAVRRAFEKELGMPVEVPEYHRVMGAIGVAVIAAERRSGEAASRFRGFDVGAGLKTRVFECSECPNRCEILEIFENTGLVATWGGLCGRWDSDR